VVYPAAELVEPGVVRVIEGNRFTLGELDGTRSQRVEAISQVLMRPGFKAPVSRDIRAEIWIKLWGNLSFNPSVRLTHATLEGICRHPLARGLAADMMLEAQGVAERLGVVFKISLEQRLAGAAAVGAHKTSMLRDVEAGARTGTGGLGRQRGGTRPDHGDADARHQRHLRGYGLALRNAFCGPWSPGGSAFGLIRFDGPGATPGLCC
jgi:hypothetical protein